MTARMYLRPDVQVDPLVHDWYAWLQIVPPAPAAFNLLERQVKAMKSFVASPELHAAALRNPAMRGGPFIDLPHAQAPAVRALLERMTGQIARQTEFVAAVRALDDLLETHADGWSLQPLYADIPAALRGLVELCYDRHHRPGFRVFEPLLYASPLYDEQAQVIALAPSRGDTARPFVFATPRLDDGSALRLRLPFRHAGLDALFASRTRAADPTHIAERLGLATDDARLLSLFTAHAPAPCEPPPGPELEVRYLGHACVLARTRDVSVLLDPLLPYAAPGGDGTARLTYADLPECIDYVLLTHGHHDHVMIETLLQIRHRTGTVVVARNSPGHLLDPSLKLMLEQMGFASVREVGEFETLPLPGGELKTLPFLGEHHDLDVHSKLCFHLRLGGRGLMFAADSCNFGHDVYRRAIDFIGPTDALFIGMECDGAPVSWVYGPAFTKKPERERDRSRRGRASNCDEALALVELLGSPDVYVYAMGSEPWLQYVLDVHYEDDSNPIVQSNRLVQTCRERGLHAQRLHGAQIVPPRL
jgi:L-ascorbate metabolism protein UlaG (beta-lactamase superfamily)